MVEEESTCKFKILGRTKLKKLEDNKDSPCVLPEGSLIPAEAKSSKTEALICFVSQSTVPEIPIRVCVKTELTEAKTKKRMKIQTVFFIILLSVLLGLFLH